jgi:hypothetical protein
MIPAVDIAYISEELRQLSDELAAAHEEHGGGIDTDPRILLDAIYALFGELQSRDEEQSHRDQQRGRGRSMQALADHGIALLTQLSALSGRLRRPQVARSIETLALPFACWIARRGGEISNLSLPVNAAAALANTIKDPAQLEKLYGLLRELTNAVNPQVAQDTAHYDSTRPWRILLLNGAIVATRSHRPALMQEAFETLIEHLPAEAPDFFREGMEQMDALDYPAHVRRVMERYFELWCGRRILH